LCVISFHRPELDNGIADGPGCGETVMEERSSRSDVEKAVLISGRWLKQQQ
jgi:hypothetical protein